MVGKILEMILPFSTLYWCLRKSNIFYYYSFISLSFSMILQNHIRHLQAHVHYVEFKRHFKFCEVVWNAFLSFIANVRIEIWVYTEILIYKYFWNLEFNLTCILCSFVCWRQKESVSNRCFQPMRIYGTST